jgi:environmental stress-induced protein Ves
MVRLLAPADCRSMPWKNGAGRTTGIVAHPPGAALVVSVDCA